MMNGKGAGALGVTLVLLASAGGCGRGGDGDDDARGAGAGASATTGGARAGTGATGGVRSAGGDAPTDGGSEPSGGQLSGNAGAGAAPTSGGEGAATSAGGGATTTGGEGGSDAGGSGAVPHAGAAGAAAASGGAGAAPATGGSGATPATGGGPARTCGDGDCAAGEACDTCEVDCGPCSTPLVTECNDGIDNDGDGLVDWQLDPGCYAARDATEASGSRAEEDGWTTFDLTPDSRVVYVSSSEGDDGNDGLSPATAVATPARGAELVRDGSPDFLLFRRGDTWRGEDLGADRVARRFKSGLDAEHPLVIGSYGDSTVRPRLEIDKNFVDHDGNDRSYVAIVGLAFASYPRIPGDPAFNGTDGGGLRLIGSGHDVLVEDCYFEHADLVVQNETDVAIRRNGVYRNYQVGTCAYNADGTRDPNGNADLRPSGMFAGSVDGLLIEGNVWDENGWNPDVPEACATIYDHDLYLSGISRLIVRENLILRASSIGIKLTSGGAGEADDILIENNLIAEGEIGISMGGNADTEYRFSNAVIRNNVFTDIGRAQPTTRTLTWYVDLIDNDGTLVEKNLLVNQPPLNNPFGVQLSGGSNRGVTIQDNWLYGLSRRQLRVDAATSWAGITVARNTFFTDATDECLIEQAGGFDAFSFAGNAYGSGASSDAWFCVDGDRLGLAEWMSSAGEADAANAAPDLPDPGRNLDRYAEQLGLGTTLADFAAAARAQSRHNYRPELDAANANNYIRAGYEVPPY